MCSAFLLASGILDLGSKLRILLGRKGFIVLVPTCFQSRDAGTGWELAGSKRVESHASRRRVFVASSCVVSSVLLLEQVARKKSAISEPFYLSSSRIHRHRSDRGCLCSFEMISGVDGTHFKLISNALDPFGRFRQRRSHVPRGCPRCHPRLAKLVTLVRDHSPLDSPIIHHLSPFATEAEEQHKK